MSENFYLIDGHAQIFRAYYAIRGGMRSPHTGEPTHAVFGYTGMLLKLLSRFHPNYVAVAIDSPGKTFRDELYGQYKATRQATPDDLVAQIPRILELTELFGIPVIGVPGLEADDIIATITHRTLHDPSRKEIAIRIVSRDKDLEQLIEERVTLLDIQTDTNINADFLLKEKGITPAQVIDVLSLMGDASDNVPGVEGIGPKTAVQLIQQFESLDGILANLDKLKGKRRESIEAARDLLLLSRQLVTLKRDAAFPFALEKARVHPIRPEKILPLLQQLGFNRYQDDVRRLAGISDFGSAGTVPLQEDTLFYSPPAGATGRGAPAPAPEISGPEDAVKAAPESDLPLFAAAVQAPVTGEYHAVTTPSQLAELAATLRVQPIISMDTETTGPSRDARLCGLSFAWKAGCAVYVPVRSPTPTKHMDESTALAALRPVLEDPVVCKCGHNLKFDARALLSAGVQLRGIVFDSMLASALVDPAQPAHQLDHLALALLGCRMIPISRLLGEGAGPASMDAAPLEKITAYAAANADIALRLYHHFSPRLDAMDMSALMRDCEAPLTAVLAEMEAEGIVCNPDELKRQGDVLQARVTELRQQIHQACGCEFDLNSPRQTAEILFDKLQLASGRKTKTGRSTDVEELERLAALENRSDPKTASPRLLLEYRRLAKLISTYLESLRKAIDPRTGRIHSTFYQLDTATGRLASQNPNLQNIPVRTDVGRQIRKAFVAAPGRLLVCADYSQVELRILAHLSEDPALIEAFARGQDIHATVAAQVFGVPLETVTREQRNHAKVINFGVIYGVTPFGLARRIEGLDVKSAAQWIADYKHRFPGIDRFFQQCVRQALESGYVRTILGRRRAIPEIRSQHRATQGLGERLAINTVVQGSAADLIKVAMVNLRRRVDREQLPLKLLLQVHDELLCETPADRADRCARVVREEMERAMTLRVPLQAEAGIGRDWLSAK